MQNQTHQTALQKNPSTIWQALNFLCEYTGQLKGDNRGGAMSIAFYEAIKEFLDAETVAETISAASRHFEGLQKDFGKSLDDVFFADPPFLYLSQYAKCYKNDFDKFAKDINLAIEKLVHTTETDEKLDEDQQQKLHLMTALRTKGKQFDAVIILDCNQNVFPITSAPFRRRFFQYSDCASFTCKLSKRICENNTSLRSFEP